MTTAAADPSAAATARQAAVGQSVVDEFVPVTTASEVRRAAIAHAVQGSALRQLAREIGIAEAVAAIAAMDDRSPRERAAEARQSLRSAVLTEYDRLTKLGRSRRDAVKMAARKFAAKGDPLHLENLARNIRRWRPRITDNVHMPFIKSGRK